MHEHPETRWLTVAVGPTGDDTGRAFTRALEVMAHADLNLVAPSPNAITAALARMGLTGPTRIAEAK